MSDPARHSNPFIFVPPIALCAIFMVGTVIAAVVLRPGIEDRMKKPLPAANLALGLERASIDRQIESKDREIKNVDSSIDFEKQMPEIGNRKGKNNNGSDRHEQVKNAEVKKLEDEMAALEGRRQELTDRSARLAVRTWGDRLADLEVGLIIKALLPLGVVSFFFVRLMFVHQLPKVPAFGLTDVEVRSIRFHNFDSGFRIRIFSFCLDTSC